LTKAFRSAAMQGFCRLGWTKNSIPKKANLFFHRSLTILSKQKSGYPTSHTSYFCLFYFEFPNLRGGIS
jgi:hypothetical protein